MGTGLTRHARARCQQRGIAIATVDWVLQFGRCVHDHRGGEIWFLDHRGRQRLARVLRNPAELDRVRNAYVVLVDGQAVTVGHRFKRIRRDASGSHPSITERV